MEYTENDVIKNFTNLFKQSMTPNTSNIHLAVVLSQNPYSIKLIENDFIISADRVFISSTLIPHRRTYRSSETYSSTADSEYDVSSSDVEVYTGNPVHTHAIYSIAGENVESGSSTMEGEIIFTDHFIQVGNYVCAVPTNNGDNWIIIDKVIGGQVDPV